MTVGATIHQFQKRFLTPLYYNLTCSAQENDLPNCTPTSVPALNCANLFGLKCLTYQEECSMISHLATTITTDSNLTPVICSSGSDSSTCTGISVIV